MASYAVLIIKLTPPSDIQSKLNVSTPQKKLYKTIEHQSTTILPVNDTEPPENIEPELESGFAWEAEEYEDCWVWDILLQCSACRLRELDISGTRGPAATMGALTLPLPDSHDDDKATDKP